MSYSRILAVVNEQTGSTVSAHYALALAATVGAELVLYSAHDEGGNGAVARHVERHVDHLFSEAIVRNIPVSRIAETGFITRLLPRRSAVEQVDLVFYPLTPGEHYGAPLQRQTAHQLLRTVKADLAIMRIMHLGNPHPHRILVPVGGVIDSMVPWIRFLAGMARTFQSQLTLFHRPAAETRERPVDLVTLRNSLRQHHLVVLERSGSGRIAKAIALEAVSHHHDLIVLGASERGALRRLIFGNPAGDVMHQPPCNAILFRPAPHSP